MSLPLIPAGTAVIVKLKIVTRVAPHPKERCRPPNIRPLAADPDPQARGFPGRDEL